jgi:uncharacterized membrane protein YedE/YeeE
MQTVTVWAGWTGGLAIGGFLLLQLVITGRHLGSSTAFGDVCGLLTRRGFFTRGKFAGGPSWRLFFFLGLPIGGLLAFLSSPETGAWTPHFELGALYGAVFPEALWAKGLVLGLGGVLMGYGARLAGGCTSGHTIMGLSLRNLPSLAASIAFFAGGLLVVNLMFALTGRGGAP